MIRVHVENSAALDALFAVTPDMVDAAVRGNPALKGRVAFTFGEAGNEFARHVADADVLVGWDFPHGDLAQRAPRLRLVQLTGAGANHLLPLDWLPSGATLANASGAHRPKIGEALLMGVLMVNNFIPALLTCQRRHEWNQLFATGLAGKTVLVIGFGNAGSSVAPYCRRFGAKVIGVSRTGESHPDADAMHAPAALHAILPLADIVVVTVPLVPATKHLLDAAALARCRRGVGIVSLGRHGVIDEAALIDALESGQVSGAVYDLEDPASVEADERLWSAPNLVILPHSLANDPARFMANVMAICCDNLARLADGRPLLNVVDPLHGY